jgi:protein TonB
MNNWTNFVDNTTSNICSTLNLGTMKTIDKKARKKKGDTQGEFKTYLVEDPSGHNLLSEDVSSKRMSIFSDLIQVKKAKDKKSKSVSLLVSSISLCLSLLLVIGMFEWKSKENGSSVDIVVKSEGFDDLLEIPQTEQKPQPPPKVQAPVIREVPDEEIIEEIELDLDIEMTEETRIEEVIVEQAKESMPEEKVDDIFTIVEVRPEPVGGIKAFYTYVGENLQYPARARRMYIEGRVFIEFVVERDGSLTDIKVAKGIGAGCDEEAVRVISQAPKWNPGKQRGRAVRVRMVMPIMFKLVG